MTNGWIVDDAARLRTLRAFGILDTPDEEAFDALVAEASALCGTPVSLITLLDADRQWFKARVGTDIRETPVELAICTHTLAQGDALTIEDLAVDPRTRANPLVQEEPHVRFYAGVPLVIDDQALGALCVLDLAPRPGGLNGDQQKGLAALAARAVDLIRAAKATPAERDMPWNTPPSGQGSAHCDWCGRTIYAPATPCAIEPPLDIEDLKLKPGAGERCLFELRTRGLLQPR